MSKKQGMWCSTSPVFPIHSIKPHRSTLCTYGAYQFGCPFCFSAESGIGNRTYEKQDIREDVLFLQSDPQ